MQNLQKLKILARKRAFVFAPFLLLALLFGGGTLGGGTAYADPPNSNLATVKYCKAQLHLSDKLEKTLCSETNMDRIRNSVREQCKDKTNKDACVEKAAEGLVDKIAKKKPKNEKDFNDAMTAVIDGANQNNNAPAGAASKNCSEDSGHCDLVAIYVNPFINILSIIVGLVVAASLIAGGIQYTASSGDPQKTSAAKSRIQNTLLAFLAYALLYAFLNFLIPGGLFH